MLPRNNFKISICFLLLSVSVLFAQSRFAGWNIYTSFKDVTNISTSGDMVWVATTGGLFSFNINSPSTSLNKYTSQDGLLSNQLYAVTVDNFGNVWSGGSDGSLNSYTPISKAWKTVTDIQNSTEPSKGINDLFQYANNMFLSTDFSIIRFNVSTFQFIDQPYINLGAQMPIKTPVYQTIVIDDTIWAATKNGIAYANINNYLPIPSNWKDFTTGNSLLIRQKTNTCAYFAGKVYFGTDSGMVYFDGTTLQRYLPLYNGVPVTDWVNHMTVSNGSMYFSTYNWSNNVYRVDQSNVNAAQLVYSGILVDYLKVSANGALLIGTSDKGVLVIKNNQSNFVSPNGPNSNLFQDITVDLLHNVWGVSGSSGNAGIYKYDGITWKNYTTENYPVMKTNNYVQIYASKFSNVVWAAGFGPGLLKIDGDNLTRYGDTNSIILFCSAQGFDLVEGIKEDFSGNLWFINRCTPRGVLIVNFTADTAYQIPTDPSQQTLIHLAIDNYNTKWMTFPPNVEGSDNGMVYFNENINPHGVIIQPSQLGTSISVVNDVTTDLNGEVWVATDYGIAIIHDPSQVIQNPGSVPFFDPMHIIENGISTPLTENVTRICIDALNNKWIGTVTDGVIYVSPDGSTILKEFNMSNSPLPDNNIMSITTDPTSGKIYFGTQKGLVSYQSIAVQPLTDCGKITAGPNPYMIPSDKLLRIDGLVEGSSVKILTISGILVNDFISPGGRIANWDGRDKNGKLVASGIYIIVGYNKDGSKVCTGKVAILRR